MDKVREEFEAWMLKKIDQLPMHLSLVKYDGGNYINDFTQISWMAWCDSRATMCVELPRTKDNVYDYNQALHDVAGVLEDIGVDYK